MTAILVRPLPFNVGTNTGWMASNPVSFMNIDAPGLVARSTGGSASFTINLGGSKTIDTVALIGSTLPSNATVKITATGYDSGPVSAYVGVKDEVFSTKTIIQFAPITVATVTVTISAPEAFQCQRLVVGRRIETDGIDVGCERGFEDRSVVENGPGFTTIDQYDVLTKWKVKMSWISQEKWHNELFPLFARVGSSRPILFIPVNEPTRFQHEAVFGLMTEIAKGEHNNHNNWVVSFTITDLAP